MYARLRREAPVYWSPRDEVWAISKYEDIRWISKQPELFSNRYHIYIAGAKNEDNGQAIPDDTGMPRQAELRRIAGMGPLYVDNLVMADGARHRFLRKIAELRLHAEGHQRDRGAGPADRGRAVRRDPRVDVELDFVDTVAAPLPMIMIALMLGVPLEDLATFRRWSDSFIEMSEDTLPQTYDEDTLNSKIGDIIEFRDYFAEQLKDRLANPRDDLLTKLTQAEWEGKPLELEEQLSMAQVLLIAGNETTRGLIAGAGKALAEHPDQRAILVGVAELMPTRSKSSSVTSRRSRTCAGPRSMTWRSGDSRSGARRLPLSPLRVGQSRRGRVGAGRRA